VNEYGGGRLPLLHLDLYRLDTPEQIVAAGLEECLARRDAVVVIEWVERWEAPGAALNVQGWLRRVWIEELAETQRRIRYEDLGR
jgi:tRNA threonylcarbamoyladenosine biosynthesis protein TsaE